MSITTTSKFAPRSDHPLPGARADFLHRFGRCVDAAAEYRRMLSLTSNACKQRFYAARRAACEEATRSKINRSMRTSCLQAYGRELPAVVPHTTVKESSQTPDGLATGESLCRDWAYNGEREVQGISERSALGCGPEDQQPGSVPGAGQRTSSGCRTERSARAVPPSSSA
jgi:hypothetical protein